MELMDGKVLIVDDEEDLRDLYVDILSEKIPTILRAENGEMALAILRDVEVDAVLSDISMPKMNGLQLLGKVREFQADLPFVVATGYGDKDNVVKALRLGAYDFLEKPIKNDHLLKVMTDAVRDGRKLRNLQTELIQLLGQAGKLDAEGHRKLKEKQLELNALKEKK